MRNRFRYISGADVGRYLAFSDSHREILSRHHLLQKLIIFDLVAPFVERHPHATILEIGCGQGVHSALLSRYGRVEATELAAPGSFVGADRNVAEARDTVLRELAGGPVTFTNNDGRHLPYADGVFDMVFHNSVIEHVPDIDAFNREVRRVLSPGGVCICITGTPALCRYRLFKDWFLKLPVHLAVALLREVPLLRELALGSLRVMGASDTLRQKARERLLRVDDRVRAVAGPEDASGAPAVCSADTVSAALYPRLFHYLYFPEYNRPVLEEMAREAGCTTGQILVRLEEHFDNIVHRLRFALTPQTHGQHARNVWEEMRSWQIAAWERSFSRSGFSLDEVVGYRYHHLLEWTPRTSWDMALYHMALPAIHAAMDRHAVRPGMASEIIIVARKEPV